jgi:uncharacterized protein (TIGR02271 family)
MSSNENQEGLLEDPNAGRGTSSGQTQHQGSVPDSTYSETSGTQGSTQSSGTEYITSSRSDQPTDRSAVIEGDEDTTSSNRQYATASTVDNTSTTSGTTFTAGDSTNVTSQTTTNESSYVAQPSQDYTTTERSTSAQTSDVDDDIRVQRHEEELQAQKVARQAGEVRVSKDVVEEQQTLEVPVTREQVTVRSVETSGSVGDTSEAFQGGTISVPVREEGVEVNKQVRVAEELEIDKRAVQDTERVTDSVRREQVNVEEVGEVDVDRHSDSPLDEDVRPR